MEVSVIVVDDQLINTSKCTPTESMEVSAWHKTILDIYIYSYE